MRLHELNQTFSWEPARGPYQRLSAAQARSYDEDGYFLLESVLSEPEIRSLRAAIDPFEQDYENLLREKHGGRLSIARADAITFTVHLVTRSAAARAFSRHRVFREVCHDTIGPNARLYWDQAVYKKAGNPEEFPWHQDNGYTFTKPQQYLTCWVPLTDATPDNGCPWVVPGVHRQGTLHHERTDLGLACMSAAEAENAVPVPARVGDVIVFSSLTPHRTGPNRTSATRKAYILQYAPDGALIRTPEGGWTPASHPDRQYLIEGG